MENEYILQEMKSLFHDLDLKFDSMKSDIETLKDDVKALKTDVETLKDDVKTLKTDVETLKDDVKTLKTDVETLKTNYGLMRADMSAMKFDMDLDFKEHNGVQQHLLERLAAYQRENHNQIKDTAECVKGLVDIHMVKLNYHNSLENLPKISKKANAICERAVKYEQDTLDQSENAEAGSTSEA